MDSKFAKVIDVQPSDLADHVLKYLFCSTEGIGVLQDSFIYLKHYMKNLKPKGKNACFVPVVVTIFSSVKQKISLKQVLNNGDHILLLND